ncbi:hypothetical protein QQZ08_001372 [Neonectria magnoliae]|uniref:BLOC-1-related complex subunit 7 n=1 Tax=Neonectria magnoliae TaxID=2732573 RepID=A0ABR1IGF3_9HYPO
MNNTKKSTLVQPEHDPQSAQSLLLLVQNLEITSSKMPKGAASTNQARTVVTEIGENLSQAALAWARLTDALVDSRQIHQAMVDAHEHARAQSQLSDLSAIVSMDLDLSKLK